ncbi:hypothetical protein [Nocardia sp. NPDC057227]|uniref:hypothetical protein n=1 Tax=Nocardia sp. NPDC057227 TaxID=3346056 RepID=UPI00363FC538
MDRFAVGTRLVVGFSPAVLSSLRFVAGERAIPVHAAIAQAVTEMLDSFGVQRDSERYAVAAVLEDRNIPDPQRDRRNFDPAHSTGLPGEIEVAEARLSEQTLARLAAFCRGARVSRARAIRMAVDRHLFETVTRPQFGVPPAPDLPSSSRVPRP